MLAWQEAVYAQTDSNRFDFLVYADSYVNVTPEGKNIKTLGPNIYSYHRVNELALNLALVDMHWKADRRTQLHVGFMTGTYAQQNLASEPELFRFLYEANVIYTLAPQKQIDLQVGIFPSHIGMESAIGNQNYALSRSLQADNSPYYESGLKISKRFKQEHGELSVLVLNGWQRMTRESGQNVPALGHQFLYHFNQKLTLNSSSFIGHIAADSMGKMRYFHNFWMQYALNKQWLCAAGFDLGNQRKGVQQYGGFWWSTLQVLTRFTLNDCWAICARFERANDFHQHLFTFKEKEAHHVNGYSMNLDCKVNSNLHWRSELRCLKEENGRQKFIGTMSLICQIQKQSL